jgi:hypothetical protein
MQAVIEWLLKGDPAIRWQVQRDLLDAEPSEYEAERARVACSGWGRRLLVKQDPTGHWGGGIYSPKWTSTTYTLLLLRDLGLPRNNVQAQRACGHFFFRGLEHDGGINWFKSLDHSETCVNAMIVALLSYFRSPDARLHDVAQFLLREQMPDGGWNCERVHGATHASLHTTILALEGLREYAVWPSHEPERVNRAVARGQEFLLRHRLYKSHRTGRVIDPEMTRLHFPPRWHFDVLRGLDYLSSVDAVRDERAKEAVIHIESRCCEDGRWLLNRPWTGRVHFEMERSGAASRWNTLRALRVLKWWYR